MSKAMVGKLRQLEGAQAGKIILAGDHLQLPPTILSEVAAEMVSTIRPFEPRQVAQSNS